MQIAHTVQTDDGSLRLALGDGDSIFDLVACGANGQEVTVHLGYHEAQRLLCGAGTVRIALNSADRARVIALVTPHLGRGRRPGSTRGCGHVRCGGRV